MSDSTANDIEIYQGDSSDIFSIAVTRAGVAVVDDDLLDYNAKLVVKKKLDDAEPAITPIEMTLDVPTNTFRGQFLPSDTEQLELANYYVIIEVTNDDISYRKEHHSRMKITKQGYEAA